MNICIVLGFHFGNNKGGAEIQAHLLANYFIKKGHKVNYICYGSKNDLIQYENNYIIHEVKKPFKIRNVFSYLNKYDIYRLLDNINPDLIYQRGVNFADLISSYGEKNNVPVISGISEDNLCCTNKITINLEGGLNIMMNHILKRYYSKSDFVISQSEKQKKLLKKNFNVNSVVIPNGHEVPSNDLNKSQFPLVLWIANIKKWKQPEIFLKLASRLIDTEAKFIYCGRSSSDGNYQNKLQRDTSILPNVKYLGEVPFRKTNYLMSKSSVFVNTSASLENSGFGRTEGFPNTYIQAWFRETPTVTLNFDPDNLIKKYKMGFHSKNFDQLVKDVRYLIENDNIREKMGRNARKYAVENHDIEKVGKRYLEIFEELIFT